MPEVFVRDDGAVVVATKEDKFLLESGQIAYVDLGQKKGWLKISLQKTGWDRGSVTLYFSNSGGFEKTQSPYRIYTDEFDPCMIKLDDLAVTLVLTGGTVSASYIELVSGAEAQLFRAKSPTRRQSQRRDLSHQLLGFCAFFRRGLGT
jgi:hypothetical protein